MPVTLSPVREDLAVGFICWMPPKGRRPWAGPGPRMAWLGLQRHVESWPGHLGLLSACEQVRVGSLAQSPPPPASPSPTGLTSLEILLSSVWISCLHRGCCEARAVAERTPA